MTDAVPIDPTIALLLDAWAEHQQTRPRGLDDPGGDLPHHVERHYDQWQAHDGAYRLLIGVRLADLALERRLRAGR